MQQTLDRSWYRDARCAGVFRYQWLALSRTFVAVMLAILLSQLISLAFPLFTNITYYSVGVNADLGMTLLVVFVCCCFATGRNARFLLRFGTSRLSVWLCTLLSLLAFAAAMLLGTFLLSLLTSGLTLWAQEALPGQYAFGYDMGILEGRELFHATLSGALGSLPSFLLYAAEWTCLLYLFTCCFRRSKLVTLLVMFGLPALACILLVIPAVSQTVNAMRDASQSELAVLALQWVKVLKQAADFIEHQWRWIQLGGALVSLPLSYWCMRETPQP